MANRYGTEGDDVLDGTFVADNIAGYGGNDVLRGFAGNDILWGGYGDDRMDGGPGADTFYGLSGFDTATYEYATSGVIIRLDGAVCQNGVTQGDKLYSVEEVIGSSFNDQLLLLEYDESDRLSWILSRNENETYSLEVRVRHTF